MADQAEARTGMASAVATSALTYLLNCSRVSTPRVGRLLVGAAVVSNTLVTHSC